MNKQRRQKMLPLQQIQAKLKQLQQSIKAAELKSLRSSVLYTENTPAEKNKDQELRHRKATPHSPQKMKTSSIIIKGNVSPKQPIKDIIKNYIKSKIPKITNITRTKTPQKCKQNVDSNKKLNKKKQKHHNKNNLSPQNTSGNKKTPQKLTHISPYYKKQNNNKSTSKRFDTYSMSEDPHKILMNSIIEDIQHMNENQMLELQQYLYHLKQEKKDECLQTSLHNEKIDIIKQHQQMAQNEVIPQNYIDELCEQREQGIKLRVNTQIEAFDHLLKKQKISPRSHMQNKLVIETWQQQQANKLIKLKNEMQKIKEVTYTLQNKINQDFQVTKQIQENESVVIEQLQQLSFDISYLEELTCEPETNKNLNNQQIQTNVGVINQFIEELCAYILNTNLDSFLLKMNQPNKQINNNQLENNQIDYPIQDYILCELQQNSMIYEKIHNKAIFYAFNEVLNQFRPFQKLIKINLINQYNSENVLQLLQKAKDKLLQYASYLCGLLNDEDDFIPQKYEDLQFINQQDYLWQLRNERLQLCVENEIQENDHLWNNIDETNILVELSDIIFEELIYELILNL